MANRLKMANINAIKTLARQGLSQRKISETLGINRRTVANYLGEDDSNCTSALTGAEAGDSKANCTSALTGPKADQVPALSAVSNGRSACEPFREVIVEMLESRLSATRIHQDLTRDHGYTGSYYSVMRFVRRLRQKHELPFRRLESAPGEEAQVDFGTDGAKVRIANRLSSRTSAHAIRRICPR